MSFAGFCKTMYASRSVLNVIRIVNNQMLRCKIEKIACKYEMNASVV